MNQCWRRLRQIVSLSSSLSTAIVTGTHFLTIAILIKHNLPVSSRCGSCDIARAVYAKLARDYEHVEDRTIFACASLDLLGDALQAYIKVDSASNLPFIFSKAGCLPVFAFIRVRTNP
jgi:hypothetical protein